jgi:aspartate racemase
MAILGIIGGIAPPSTIDYYQRLVARHRELAGDEAYPTILINSVNFTRVLRLVESGRRDDLTAFLAGELARLAAAGADLALLAANTPHVVFDDLTRRTTLPLVSIVEAACAATVREGYRRVGLLGARFVMSGSFYPAVFTRADVTLVPPHPDEQEYVHDKYLSELVRDEFRSETREAFVRLIARMTERDRLDAVLLAGTELPLLLRGSPTACPVLDTTAIHVEAAVSRLLAVGPSA